MHLFEKILVIILFASVAQTANAQNNLSENNTGSFYSLFGMGLPFDNTTARESGIGVLGVSLDDTESNSLQNPALWGSNTLTTASTGFSLSQFQAKSLTDESTNALLEAGYVQITFPLYRNKLGASASLYPVTKSSYRIFSNDVQIPAPGDTIGFVTDLKGTGGVNKLELGFGWKINKNFSVGYAPALAFISKNSTEKVFFQQSGYSNNQVDNRITGVAFAQRFGALFSIEKMSIGASLSLPINIDAKREKIATRTISNQVREVSLNTVEGAVNLPLEINSGITYYPSSFVNISLEGQLQKWSEFETELPSGHEGSDITMSDRYRLGLGTEYHPYKFNSGKFLSKFRYTAGLSYDSGHLSMKGQNIDTYWVSAGLGILSRAQSTVDISFQYGIRGTTSNNLVQENIWALNLSINLMEFMFHRPKLN